jgi:hypothetical protein
MQGIQGVRRREEEENKKEHTGTQETTPTLGSQNVARECVVFVIRTAVQIYD